MDTARSRVLSSIRSAYAGDKRGRPDLYSDIARDYVRSGALSPEARLDLFVDRIREYDAGIYFTAQNALPVEIGKILDRQNRRRILIPDDLSSEWLPVEFQFTGGNRLSPQEIEKYDGVLTGCTVAIALTGTLVLQNAFAQGTRTLSLVPDYHLCVVFLHQLVETVPEAIDRLKPTDRLPTTFISGPSATADIEMTRIKGVHGPRQLDVVVVTS